MSQDNKLQLAKEKAEQARSYDPKAERQALARATKEVREKGTLNGVPSILDRRDPSNIIVRSSKISPEDAAVGRQGLESADQMLKGMQAFNDTVGAAGGFTGKIPRSRSENTGQRTTRQPYAKGPARAADTQKLEGKPQPKSEKLGPTGTDVLDKTGALDAREVQATVSRAAPAKLSVEERAVKEAVDRNPANWDKLSKPEKRALNKKREATASYFLNPIQYEEYRGPGGLDEVAKAEQAALRVKPKNEYSTRRLKPSMLPPELRAQEPDVYVDNPVQRPQGPKLPVRQGRDVSQVREQLQEQQKMRRAQKRVKAETPSLEQVRNTAREADESRPVRTKSKPTVLASRKDPLEQQPYVEQGQDPRDKARAYKSLTSLNKAKKRAEIRKLIEDNPETVSQHPERPEIKYKEQPLDQLKAAKQLEKYNNRELELAEQFPHSAQWDANWKKRL